MMQILINLVTALGGYTPTILTGLFLGSGIFLIIKKWIKLPERLIVVIWLLFIFSLSLLIATQITITYKRHQLKSVLINLSPDEKEALNKFISKNVISFYSEYRKDSIMVALEKKGLIYKAYDSAVRGAVYNINQEPFILLKKHPDWIGVQMEPGP